MALEEAQRLADGYFADGSTEVVLPSNSRYLLRTGPVGLGLLEALAG